VSLKLLTPPSDLTIDEAVELFTGRSKYKGVTQGKPDEEGFKVWIIATKGYALTWMYHATGPTEGPQGLKPDLEILGTYLACISAFLAYQFRYVSI
jgi:hypothetical protein